MTLPVHLSSAHARANDPHSFQHDQPSGADPPQGQPEAKELGEIYVASTRHPQGHKLRRQAATNSSQVIKLQRVQSWLWGGGKSG